MKINRRIFQSTNLLLVAMLLIQIANAQPIQIFAIESHPLEISAERTVAVSFPFSITSVDRGSSQILAQKAKGTQNVLLLKASHKDIKPSSLIVITSDGAIHSFEVRYLDRPHSLHVISNPESAHRVQTEKGIEEHLINDAIELARQHPSNFRKRSADGQVSAAIEGLFVKDQFMLIRLTFENKSAIDYDVESIRMFVGDRKQVKRTASQLNEILPLKISGALNQIKGSEQRSLVIAIPKMTLPTGKQFSVEVTERRGARRLRISLRAKKLRRVSVI